MNRAAAKPKPAPEPVTLPADMADVLWGTKDLARYMGISTRRVKVWWKKFRIPPDACAVNSCHRWTPGAVVKLLTKWRAAWRAQGLAAEEATALFQGRGKPTPPKVRIGGWSRRRPGKSQLKLVFR